MSGASKASHYLAKNLMVYRRASLLRPLSSQAQALAPLPPESRREPRTADLSGVEVAEARMTEVRVRCVSMLMQRSAERYAAGRRDDASAAELRRLGHRLARNASRGRGLELCM